MIVYAVVYVLCFLCVLFCYVHCTPAARFLCLCVVGPVLAPAYRPHPVLRRFVVTMLSCMSARFAPLQDR